MNFECVIEVLHAVGVTSIEPPVAIAIAFNPVLPVCYCCIGWAQCKFIWVVTKWMRCSSHLRCAFRQAAQVADVVAVDILAFSFLPDGHLSKSFAAWGRLGMAIILRCGLGCCLVEFPSMACTVRSSPQHHDAVVVDASASVVGFPGHWIPTLRCPIFVAQPKNDPILRR
ncbi:hypothetical protein Y887_04190 [Xanthomonas pisi DSM 18956]|nr:hypothetical protein Y887_04190 [Xanthomonas pisi DSM 18956]